MTANAPPSWYLAVDQYQRYRFATDVLRSFCEHTQLPLEGRTVLDLGGVQGFARYFLPREVRITTANLVASPRDLPAGEGDEYVLTTEGPLPFADEAFDFVITCDVLEHVPPQQRAEFLSQVARVARGGAVVLAPFDTSGVREAERLVGEVYRSVFRRPCAWFEEHELHGLPSLDAITEEFGLRFASHQVLPTSYLPNWVHYMTANILLAGNRNTAAVNQNLTDLYAALHYASDHRPPAYRYALVGLKQEAYLPLPMSPSEPAPETPSESLGMLLPNIMALGVLRDFAEVAACEEQNQQLLKEREHLQEQLSLREAAVTAHAKQVQATTADREELARQVEEGETSLVSVEAGCDLAESERADATREAHVLQTRLTLLEAAGLRNAEHLQQTMRERDEFVNQVAALSVYVTEADAAREEELARLQAHLMRLEAGLTQSVEQLQRTMRERDELVNQVATLSVSGTEAEAAHEEAVTRLQAHLTHNAEQLRQAVRERDELANQVAAHSLAAAEARAAHEQTVARLQAHLEEIARQHAKHLQQSQQEQEEFDQQIALLSAAATEAEAAHKEEVTHLEAQLTLLEVTVTRTVEQVQRALAERDEARQRTSEYSAQQALRKRR